MWIVYALLASVFWGLNYVLAERLFKAKVTPVTLVGVEMLFGSIVLLAVSYFSKLTHDAHVMKDNLWLSLACISTMIVGNLMIATSIHEKNATLAGLIEISYPVFIILFTLLLFGTNHMTPSVWVGGSLIFAGVGIIYWFAP
jgi:drug/metabolite transporter (DMT)-like permease